MSRSSTADLPRWMARSVGAFGLLCLAASIFAPWFRVPGVSGEPPAATACRLLALFVLVTAFRYRRERARLEQTGFGFLALLLLFPYFVTVWSPRWAGEAGWLAAQHESLTGSAGDLFLAQETRSDLWRHRVDVVNRPLLSEVVDFPDWPQLDLGRFIDICDWFGTSPWFAVFVRKGWVLALGGTILCLLMTRREGGPSSRVGAGPRRHGFAPIVVAFVLAAIPPSLAVWQLARAREATRRGELELAATRLAWAGRLFPALAEHGYFVAQRGFLDHARGLDTAEAAVHRARLLEQRGLDAQARALYLAELEADPAVRRECERSLLALAADALNTGEVQAAAEIYDTVLAVDPHNLKAIYASQLAAVRRGDLARTRALRDQMFATYRELNAPTKKAVLALAHENFAFAAALDGDPRTTAQALAQSRRP